MRATVVPSIPVRALPNEKGCVCHKKDEACRDCRYTYGYMRAWNDLDRDSIIWSYLWKDRDYLTGYEDGAQDLREAELNY